MGIFVIGCQKAEAPKEQPAPTGGYGQPAPEAEQPAPAGGYGQPPAPEAEQPAPAGGYAPGESGGYGQQK